MCTKDAFEQLVEVLPKVNSSLQLDGGMDLDDSTMLVSFVHSLYHKNVIILTYLIDSKIHPPHTYILKLY